MSTVRQSEHGFSLIELLVVVAILTLIMGTVFRQIVTVQQRYRAEEAKLDTTQEAREFLDQMVRDLHQVGYPTVKMYYNTSTAANLLSPANKDQRVAAGMVKFAYNDIWFEGDVDGDGQVEVIRYTLATGAGGKCPCILQRNETKPKLNNTLPMAQATTNYQTSLDNVVNSAGSGGAGTNGAYLISGTGPGGVSNDTLYGALEGAYIFKAYDSSGNAISPTDIATDPTTMGRIASIRITINVLAAPSASDLQTRRRSPVSLTATARLPYHN
jgi:prepilin-type N-terminal cleavage/methylation domain-containing protein